MKKMIVMAALLFISGAVYSAENVSQMKLSFIKAGASYQTEDYPSAIDQYSHILSQGYESAAVHYNLGNAYFKSERLGNSIIHFERAYRLAPRDPDVEANLRFARSLVNNYGREDSAESAIQKGFSYFDRFTMDEMLGVLFLLMLSLACVLVSGYVFQWSLRARVGWSVSLTILLIIQSVFLFTQYARHKNAAIILTDISAKFEPMDNATDHFQLGEGMKVDVLNLQYGWYKIKRSDGRVGWVPKLYLERI